MRYVSFKIAISCAALMMTAACGDNDDGSGGSVGDPPGANPPVVDLPPDPGEAGLQTIPGIDSDADGVRDDLQIYIAERFPGSDPDRMALMQVAAALQAQLDLNRTDAQHVATANRVLRSVGCYLSVESPTALERRADEVALLQSRLVNTADRLGAYRSFDAAVGGQVFTLLPLDQQVSSCGFDVE